MPCTDSTEFFSSFEPGHPRPAAAPGLRGGSGPDRALAARARVGYSGLHALRYAAPRPCRTLLFTPRVRVSRSYVVFPESAADCGYRSTFVALDVEFDDGSLLPGLAARDGYGAPLSAAGQGAARLLYLDQWNLVRCAFSRLAPGRTVTAIALVLEPTPGAAAGRVDDVRPGERVPPATRAQVDYVRTTRGTHSSRHFSRGNTIPATTVPHGFDFWTPVTDADALDWPGEYHRGDVAGNLPALQALAVSHQPSPWVDDRHTFQVMPGTGPVRVDRAARALTFSQDDETDLPYHYGVPFGCGIGVDVAPTDHAAVLRFAFPDSPGRVLFDNTRNRGRLYPDPARGTVTGHTWVKSRQSAGARRMYVHAVFDQWPLHGARLNSSLYIRVTGYPRFDDPIVVLRVATSLIGAAQARRNLFQEAQPGKRVGRKGLARSIFLGCTPLSIREGLSWALEGCVRDFGLAAWSHALRETCPDGDPRRREYADNATYFRDRALCYANHVAPRTGFFRPRRRDGSWRTTAKRYDPEVRGYDYPETNGWNAAFSAPHGGAELAALHGGRAALRSTLDTFFRTPETARKPGSYRRVIHEMTEARAGRMGQYGHSNQPSHHIPWMYLHAGYPAGTQRTVRDALPRLYTGGELGQGYPGREDNGEMSAWYVFAALGLYPLAPGRPGYAVGSPLFRGVRIRLRGDRRLVIRAPASDSRHVYVRGVTVDGEQRHAPWLPHDVLARGATIEFDLSPEPARWGACHPPPALNRPGQRPGPLTDLTGPAVSSDRTPSAALFDDTTRTGVAFRSRTPSIQYTVDGPVRAVRRYTLTSATGPGDPVDWVLEGSTDARSWRVLDERRDERFRRRRQTRPSSSCEPAALRHYRLRVTATRGRRRPAQWELLAGPNPPARAGTEGSA